MNFSNDEQMLEAFNAFLVYARSYPALYEAVVQKFIILRNTLPATSPVDLAVARDAASSLVMMAREAGYHEMERYFYGLYESLCASLLACYQGGSL